MTLTEPPRAPLSRLVALARSSAREERLELLREITDVFLERPEARRGPAGEDVDHILTTVTAGLDERDRASVAKSFTDADAIPPGLAEQLAFDVIEVARDFLQNASALSDDLLARCVRERDAAHQTAIAQRTVVSPQVSAALVERGDHEVLVALASNQGAQFAEETMERLVELAEAIEGLHAPLVGRADTPPHLLQQLYFVVETSLREKIAARCDALSDTERLAVMEAARTWLKRKLGDAPQDFEAKKRDVERMVLRRQLTAGALVRMLQANEVTKFDIGLATLAELDFNAVRRARLHNDIEPLATICRAANIETQSFLAMAMYRETRDDTPVIDTNALSRLYDEIDTATAERVLRFWRVRSGALTR